MGNKALSEYSNVQEECGRYLSERSSSYWFRCRRYKAVAQKLFDMGLANHHLLVDIGAGRCDFDYYLRVTHKWRGKYLPIDGVIDGTNIDNGLWNPPYCDFITAIEVIEHLYKPTDFLAKTINRARHGVVITTPNPRTTNVLGMDRTHVSPISQKLLSTCFPDMQVEERSFFGKPEDSLLAWRKNG